METHFAGQPFAGSHQIGATICGALESNDYDHAWFATAWVKRSGLNRLAEEIRAFQSRGGRVDGILGIDYGAATFEGLELALKELDDVYVFHHPGERTFHPKLYVAQGDTKALVIIGSGNFTVGGLYTNYEAAFVGNLDLTAPKDAAFLSGVREYYDSLLAQSDFCRLLSADLIADLREDPGTNVVTERQFNKARNLERRKQPSLIFGMTSEAALLDAPPADDVGVENSQKVTSPQPAPEENAEEADGKTADDTDPPTVRRWYKKLPRADAQQLDPATSSRSASVTLVQAGHPIDSGTYFRDEFFGGEVWSNNVGGKAEASVKFKIDIDGLSATSLVLTLVHDPRFESDQGNRTTLLRWGDRLNEHMRNHDHTGEVLTLEQLADGSYRLTVSTEPTGTFAY